MSALRPENRALFRAARADFEPTERDRARVEKGLAAALGTATIAATTLVASDAAAASTVATSAGAASATSSGVGVIKATSAAVASVSVSGASAKGSAVALGFGISHWALVGVGVIVVVASGIGVATLRPSGLPTKPSAALVSPAVARAASSTRIPGSSAPTTMRPENPVGSPVTSVAPTDPTAAPSSGSMAHAPSVAPMPRSSNGAAPVAPAGAAPETRLSQEARLLRDAQNAVRMGDTAMANRLLDEHARAFPHGVLEEEREAERTLLQCASGTDAVVAGERFLRRFPDSLLVARVRSACLP